MSIKESRSLGFVIITVVYALVFAVGSSFSEVWLAAVGITSLQLVADKQIHDFRAAENVKCKLKTRKI